MAQPVILELAIMLGMPELYQNLHSTSARQFLNCLPQIRFQLMPNASTWMPDMKVKEEEGREGAVRKYQLPSEIRYYMK